MRERIRIFAAGFPFFAGSGFGRLEQAQLCPLGKQSFPRGHNCAGRGFISRMKRPPFLKLEEACGEKAPLAHIKAKGSIGFNTKLS